MSKKSDEIYEEQSISQPIPIDDTLDLKDALLGVNKEEEFYKVLKEMYKAEGETDIRMKTTIPDALVNKLIRLLFWSKEIAVFDKYDRNYPAEITYNSNNTAYVYNSSIPSYESFYDVSYYYSNSTITQPIYANTFAASGNVSFSLNIDNQSFINVHSVLLELPAGIYAYNFTINNKTSTGILYVNNQDTNTILAISLYSNNYVLYLYLGIVFLSLALIGKYTRGFVVSYTLSGLLFVFIGYKEHIEFFTQNLIILIITFLALLFTYKVVMEE